MQAANSTEASLIDPFGRRIEYVRLSVTDVCDLRCFYCLPKSFNGFTVPEHWLTFDEIERVMAAFAQLGVQRVRLTGGEPLVRKDLPGLAQRLAALDGIRDLSLSTNATRLGKQAQALKQAGVTRINVSLDTLRADRFKAISGGKLVKVMDGLMAAKQVGLAPIKINTVAMRGINEDEFPAMVDFCIEHGFILRFIETMPVGKTGLHGSNHYLNLDQVRADLAQRFDLIPSVMPGGGPARYVRVQGTQLNIGFITPISQHFCATCNRVRLTASGALHLCLGQDDRLELRPLLRQGIGDDELLDALRAAIALKPERHEFREKPGKVVRFMAMTGG